MEMDKTASTVVENHLISSAHLNREVKVDLYLPVNISEPGEISLLLINDGQDLVKMDFQSILEELYSEDAITPVLCVAIHCSKDRRNEYGTAGVLDYKGRGTKAQ